MRAEEKEEQTFPFVLHGTDAIWIISGDIS